MFSSLFGQKKGIGPGSGMLREPIIEIMVTGSGLHNTVNCFDGSLACIICRVFGLFPVYVPRLDSNLRHLSLEGSYNGSTLKIEQWQQNASRVHTFNPWCHPDDAYVCLFSDEAYFSTYGMKGSLDIYISDKISTKEPFGA